MQRITSLIPKTAMPVRTAYPASLLGRVHHIEANGGLFPRSSKDGLPNRSFKFQKRRQLFIRAGNQTLSVAAMSINNPNRSPLGTAALTVEERHKLVALTRRLRTVHRRSLPRQH